MEIKTLENKKTAAEQFELLMELACSNGALIEDGLASMQDKLRIEDYLHRGVAVASISVYGYGDDPYDPSKRVVSIGVPHGEDGYISVYLEKTWLTVSLCIEGESPKMGEHEFHTNIITLEESGERLMDMIATGIRDMRDVITEYGEQSPEPGDEWDRADEEYEAWRDRQMED